MAVVGPSGEWTTITQTGNDERIANMETFAAKALAYLEDVLRDNA